MLCACLKHNRLPQGELQRPVRCTLATVLVVDDETVRGAAEAWNQLAMGAPCRVDGRGRDLPRSHRLVVPM